MNETAKQHLMAAHAAICKKNYLKAIALYREIMNREGEGPETLYMTAYCYREMDEQDKAVLYAEKVLSLKPAHFHALQLLADVHEGRGEHDRTYEYVTRALECPPLNHAPMPGLLKKGIKLLAKVTDGNELKQEMYDTWELEPEDRDWLQWAQEFKENYEEQE